MRLDGQRPGRFRNLPPDISGISLHYPLAAVNIAAMMRDHPPESPPFVSPFVPYPSEGADKLGLRRHFLDVRAALHEDYRRAAAEAACVRLRALIGHAPATVAGYAPMRGELDILPLLARLRLQGFRTALPMIAQKSAPLEFRLWDGSTLEEGMYGTRCPSLAAQAEPDMVIVPLLAFDRARHRLGYGGGYYDRTLEALRKRNPHVKAYGAAFACQEASRIPAGKHDIALDGIATELEVIA